MPQDRSWGSWIPVLVTSLVVLAGCDATLQPFAGEAGLFSVYGYLTLSNEQHYIRVKDLREPIQRDSTRTINATVRLKNLDTGTTETLTDSLVVIDGVYTHNFRTDQDIQPEAGYQLTVEGPGGGITRTKATMPAVTETAVNPSEGVECFPSRSAGMSFGFPGLSDSRFVDVSVGASYGGTLHFEKLRSNALFFRLKPAVVVEEVVPDQVLLYEDCNPSHYCRLLDNRKMHIAYTHYGPDFPPDSVQANPLSPNVQNGAGAFFGIHRDTITVTIDTKIRCPGAATVPCEPAPPAGGNACPDVGGLP